MTLLLCGCLLSVQVRSCLLPNAATRRPHDAVPSRLQQHLVAHTAAAAAVLSPALRAGT
jgi:hypothetical protein